MKFTEAPYQRPDMKALEQECKQLVGQFREATSFSAQDRLLEKINQLRNHFESMREIAQIRHTIDTTDDTYKDEQDFYDEVQPIYQGIVTNYYNALLASPYRAELEQKWGKQLFTIVECTVKTFSEAIIADLQTENKLSSEYTKLMASARIDFEGEERTLSQLYPFEVSKDRSMRKKASEARYGFMQANEEKLDQIYDQLVKVRTNIARTLGYENFIEVGYMRMNRSDYNAEMVAAFREQVRKYIVPVAAKLRERQRQRIGVEQLMYYDNDFIFKTGNATPKGSPEWIVANARQMYKELSPETDEFFTMMIEQEMMDLVSKKGKAGGGYCTYIPSLSAPFIFSNFNGTSGDIDVLTHEAGHALQAYVSGHYQIPEYYFPTSEAAEIHSMSMEFITWPWMHLFFQEETDKYKFSHLSEALMFIPYGVAVDEFQHFVYAHPSATPAERKRAWREIERTYLPQRNYAGNDYLERGGFWQRQAHIFNSPFYYIDYTLAQVCAFQFWKRAHEDREAAWTDYMHLCKLGGSRSFTELVAAANLISPFDESCIQSVIGEIEAWLNQVDDAAL